MKLNKSPARIEMWSAGTIKLSQIGSPCFIVIRMSEENNVITGI